MIRIERGIDLPNRKRGKSKYPYEKMRVGDSFEVTGKKKSTVLWGATQWAKNNNKKWKFTIRTEETGIRIWRIK